MNINIISTTICGLATILCVGCGGNGANRTKSINNTNADEDSQAPLTLLVGSYSNPGDTALRVYDFYPRTDSVSCRASIPVSNASYFTFAPSGMLYAVSESDKEGSSVTALRPTGDPEAYEVVNSLPVGSASPCYINVSPDGRFVATANYSGGTVTIFPIAADGSLLPRKQTIKFDGSGPVTDRQEKSHPHCVTFTPDGKYMLVNDLGMDQIHQFRLLREKDTLVESTPTAEVQIRPGSGPRHLVFDRQGTTAYLVNELADNVTVLKYDGSTLSPVQYIAADTLGAMGAGDIHLSPDERHLYASLRLKNDGVVTYDVDPQTGLLTYKAHTPTLRHPRNFTLTPDGSQMLVAGRDDNAVQIFSVDPTTGIPAPTGQRINLPKPVCVKIK